LDKEPGKQVFFGSAEALGDGVADWH
jgi:hypothetical protein